MREDKTPVRWRARRSPAEADASAAPVGAAEEAADAEPILHACGLAKSFGATQALRDASFALQVGEVHALLGENGSGKSTLVKILAGVHVPAAGSIEMWGRQIAPPRTPADAQRHGIAAVFQEVLVAGSRTVYDNLWMGTSGLLRQRASRSDRRSAATRSLTALLGSPLDLDTRVEDLSLSDRQACAIVRALLRRPKVLILDEATSALDFSTRDRLFEMVRELRDQGTGIILITHRLDEIASIADRTTVLRSGATVATRDASEADAPELLRLMTGTDQPTAAVAARPPFAAEHARPVMSIKRLRLRPQASEMDIVIREGELVGVAGLEGHGQVPFLDALRGAGSVDGQVLIHGEAETADVGSTAEAARSGVAYVGRERGQAIFGWMSIRENFAMPTLKQDSSFGWLHPARSRARFRRYVDDLGIVLGSEEDRITSLSGGNQQKVVIARWLAAAPRVLLLNDPTRGIDIRAKRDLYALLGKLADQGVAVVMHSSELDEHVELMDRVLVFREQELFCVIERADVSRQSLMAALFGRWAKQEAAL
jgi:ABC-type sugar transport system ATPase subunit